MNAEVNAIIESSQMQEQWTKMGIDRMKETPDQFAAWLAKESDKWAQIIRANNIKAE
jgi:tripartite-type tricarboxylate transporter receptor subunit TctC